MMCATCYFVVVVAVFGSPLFSSARLLRGRRTRDRTVDPRARAHSAEESPASPQSDSGSVFADGPII